MPTAEEWARGAPTPRTGHPPRSSVTCDELTILVVGASLDALSRWRIDDNHMAQLARALDGRA